LSIVDEATELANQTQDEQAIGWASGSMGARNLHRGDYPAAAANFETSCMILEAIHDFRSLTHMLSRWGLCEARIGRPQSALHLLEKSAQVAKLHNVGVLFEGRALAPATEALLCIGEQTSDLKLRLEVLLRAKSACQRLQKIGHRISDESGPEASRLTGTYCWLVGDRRRAVQNWQNGIKLAEKLGAIHVLAKIHNEIGLRMSDASHARKAKVLFDATGAHAE
jgi:tetratricopeptide (TPR) repeat protein